MLAEGHTDEMTAKWLSQTPNPPRIPEIYTLTKIHKPTLVGRPIIQYLGVTAPQREFHALSTTSSADSTTTRILAERFKRFYKLL